MNWNKLTLKLKSADLWLFLGIIGWFVILCAVPYKADVNHTDLSFSVIIIWAAIIYLIEFCYTWICGYLYKKHVYKNFYMLAVKNSQSYIVSKKEQKHILVKSSLKDSISLLIILVLANIIMWNTPLVFWNTISAIIFAVIAIYILYKEIHSDANQPFHSGRHQTIERLNPKDVKHINK